MALATACDPRHKWVVQRAGRGVGRADPRMRQSHVVSLKRDNPKLPACMDGADAVLALHPTFHGLARDDAVHPFPDNPGMGPSRESARASSLDRNTDVASLAFGGADSCLHHVPLAGITARFTRWDNCGPHR